MTLKARKCKGCKALPKDKTKGVCAMDRNFVTCDGEIIPLAPCCPSKSITISEFNYKLSLKDKL